MKITKAERKMLARWFGIPESEVNPNTINRLRTMVRDYVPNSGV